MAEHSPVQLVPWPHVTLVRVVLGEQQPTSIDSLVKVKAESKKSTSVVVVLPIIKKSEVLTKSTNQKEKCDVRQIEHHSPWQSTVPQGCNSVRLPVQLPPKQARILSFDPGPHVTEHSVQSVQSVQLPVAIVLEKEIGLD